MRDFESDLRDALDPSARRLTIAEEWQGFPGTAFGGFVAGVTLIAASTASEHPRPLTAWFYRPEARATPTDEGAGWLATRTSVPVSWVGFTVGRTQVWAGDRLAVEGMSQVALVPPMPE